LNNETRRETQIKLHEAVAVLTHASQIWTTTKKQEAKIETAEMKLLRSAAGPNEEN
jgi:hypothetical protein